jgi:hypothetical protein
LSGGTTVEVLREIRFKGPQLDWEETLVTALVEESVFGNFNRARFVRGVHTEGDRELSIVPINEYGDLVARVPVGSSLLEVPREGDSSGNAWDPVRMVEIR